MLIFDFNKEYVLEDDFVKLSPLRMEHIASLLEISEEPNLWTYFLEKGNGLQNLTKYVADTIDKRKRGTEYPFIVFDKTTNQYAGSTRFYDFIPELDVLKLGHTWYGNNFRGTGLNKRCKYLLFQFVFEKIGAERLGFGAHAENKVSIAAMESVGCKKEGVLRGFLPAMDTTARIDVVLMSILKSDWQLHAKTGLKNKIETNTASNKNKTPNQHLN
ncbi:GNAT family N-acetyltransferase [Spongiimicrobium sp. 3-5]|uniref:GNAT family N-acetyltransferase n=1 Tax=Spongiimicrobium sp. 3-5 TaxID=3332596 RepID=UPI0039811810